MIVILIVYVVLFLIWAIGSVVAIYHNVSYFEPKSKMKIAMMTYIWLAIILILYSAFLILNIDWTQPINVRV